MTTDPSPFAFGEVRASGGKTLLFYLGRVDGLPGTGQWIVIAAENHWSGEFWGVGYIAYLADEIMAERELMS